MHLEFNPFETLEVNALKKKQSKHSIVWEWYLNKNDAKCISYESTANQNQLVNELKVLYDNINIFVLFRINIDRKCYMDFI